VEIECIDWKLKIPSRLLREGKDVPDILFWQFTDCRLSLASFNHLFLGTGNISEIQAVSLCLSLSAVVDCIWNVMAHAQKPDFVFRRSGRVQLKRRGLQFSRLLAAEVCTLAVVMLDTPCSEVVWRVLATHTIRQFPLYFPSRASPCAVTFQLDATETEHMYI
jgi:hypothetical protein